ncbi:hypothetical protein V8E55_001130 [Tylopilus felleus]
MGDIESDRSCENVDDGIGYDGRQYRKDGATSAPRCDSKQVETDLLAKEHEQRWDTTSDVTRVSTPPPDHPGRPTNYPNPPRRRGRMKTRPGRISSTWTKRTPWRITSRPYRTSRVYVPNTLGKRPTVITNLRDVAEVRIIAERARPLQQQTSHNFKLPNRGTAQLEAQQ